MRIPLNKSIHYVSTIALLCHPLPYLSFKIPFNYSLLVDSNPPLIANQLLLQHFRFKVLEPSYLYLHILFLWFFVFIKMLQLSLKLLSIIHMNLLFLIPWHAFKITPNRLLELGDVPSPNWCLYLSLIVG